MSSLSDKVYFQYRVEQELDLANRAAEPGIRNLHARMAKEYRKRVAQPDPALGKRLFMLRHEPLSE